MAMLDRLKDATRPTNSIETVQPPAPFQRPADLHGANPGGPPDAPPAAKKLGGDAKAPAYTTEPEAISRAYYVEDRGGGERRYFDDYQRKSLAIKASDNSISTKKEDLNTIRAMLTMAEARGWSEVKVAGTADFKREAWIEAQARGITAQGHKVTDLDRQEADRRRTERGLAPVSSKPDMNEVRPVTGAQATSVASAPVQAAASMPQQDPEAPQQARPAPAQQPSQAAPVYALSVRNLGVVPGPANDQRQQTTQQQDAPALRLGKPADASAPQPATGVAGPQEAVQAVRPAAPDHRKALKDATAELSPDGRLVLTALSEKIDRQMNKLNAEAKLETKAFAATELVKKEKMEGPVVLSPELRKLATAPEPVQAKQPPAPAQQPIPARQVELEPPQRTRSR